MSYLDNLFNLEKTNPELAYLVEHIVERLDSIIDRLEEAKDAREEEND